jgi:hypothetical protein
MSDPREPSQPSVADRMAAYAADAVEFAHSRFDVVLDYSPASIAGLETVVARLADAKAQGLVERLFKKAPTEEQLKKMCEMFGGYLGEVYRREVGGEWAMNREFDTIGIKRGDEWFFPPAKVSKRLSGKLHDSLVAYYEAMRSKG